MNPHPYRLLKIVLVLVAVVTMTILVGSSAAAGPMVSPTSSALMTTNASPGSTGDTPFYVVLGALDLVGFVALYRLVRRSS